MKKSPLTEIPAGPLSAQQLESALTPGAKLVLSTSAITAIDRAARTVAQVVKSGKVIYGINTGFGRLASTRIKAEDLAELQRRLLLSHAVGVGMPFDDQIIRRVLLLKINSLSCGFSGVRREIIEALIALYNAEVYPLVPRQGSVGASGDLAPLAHLCLPLIGEGKCRHKGKTISGAEGMKKAGLKPLVLAAKEGLGLINGTQVSTALALDGLARAKRLFAAALASGALSVDAAAGSDAPFDARIHAIRGHAGQIEVARIQRALLAKSPIRASHVDCERVQDPYSLRCQPQVMGAVLELLRNCEKTLVTEANAVSDNPLVFVKEGEIISGGNFHAEPVAFAADILALGIAEIGAMSERRIALLVDASISGLPAFLVAEPGLNSGFMILHVTAAALVSENKQQAYPASVDSIPTSANQEDHVSMATHGAARLGRMLASAERIVAIELLAAAQGIDFRKPLKTSPILGAVHKTVRKRSATLSEDRSLSEDIEAVAKEIRAGAFYDLLADKTKAKI